MINQSMFDKETKIALKFILTKIKKLVIDRYGRMSYIDNFDEVIYDIFNYKHLGRKLDECRSDRDTAYLLTDFGFKQIMIVCNTPKIYAAIAELISINIRQNEIKKEFKKAQKKNKKKDKDLVKELEYITELYKDGLKVIRKKLGISKKSSSYKKRYSNLSDLVKTRDSVFYEDDDEYGILMYSDDDDEDDFYDDDAETEFERFRKKFGLGDSSQKRKKKVKPLKRSLLDDDDDEDFEDDYDLDDDDEDFEDDVSKKIDKLFKQVSMLSSTVQQLVQTQTDINQNDAYVIEKARLNGKLPPYHYSDPRTQTMVNQDSLNLSTNDDTKNQNKILVRLVEDVQNIGSAVRDITKVQKAMMETQDEIVDFMNAITEDDDENIVVQETEAFGYAPSQNREAVRAHYKNLDHDPDGMENLTRAELIDIINNENTKAPDVVYEEPSNTAVIQEQDSPKPGANYGQNNPS